MNALQKLSVLAMLPLTLTGCFQTLTTERLALKADANIVSQICGRAWKAIKYDSLLDTPLTVEEVRAANRAREAFCGKHG